MTRITLENCYHKVSIEVDQDDLNIVDLWEKVIEPLLLGTGYLQETIDGLFASE